jgi:hypothetical protein
MLAGSDGGVVVVALLGRVEAEVGVAGQLGGASAGAFGQVAFGQGLQAPGDEFDQPGAVAGAVASPKTSAKRCRSWPTVRRGKAATSLTMLSCTGFSLVGLCQRSTRVDSEPHLAEKLKAIRDKKERFFELVTVTGRGGILATVPIVKEVTGG